MIREATALDAAAVARVHVQSWRSAYRGIIEDRYLDALSEADRERWWMDWFANHPPTSFLRVAVDDSGQVEGFAMGGQSRAQAQSAVGEIYVLYLLTQAQRRGVGTQLMRSMARGIEMRGMRSLTVWVLEQNTARAFYEKLGGRLDASRPTSVGGQRLTEVAYVWDALEPLLT